MQEVNHLGGSWISPDSISEGRDQLWKLSSGKETHNKIKTVIKNYFDVPIGNFKKRSRKGHEYDLNTHKFYLHKGKNNNFSTALKSHLIYLVEGLAGAFGQIAEQDNSTDIQNYLLHKLGVDNFDNTEAYINSKEKSEEKNKEVHEKLDEALNKMKKGTFLSKVQKDEKRAENGAEKTLVTPKKSFSPKISVKKKKPTAHIEKEKTDIEKVETEKIEKNEAAVPPKDSPITDIPKETSGFARFISGMGSFFTSIFHFFTFGCFR